MVTKKVMVWVFGLALASAPAIAMHAQEGPPPPPPGAWEPGPPPGNWSQIWHNGFHDGVEAARHDLEAHRPPNPRRHDTFRHPDLPGNQQEDFREGFKHGYRMMYDHAQGR